MKNLYLTRIQTAAIALYMRSEVRTISCEKHLHNISHMHTRACVCTHRPAHRPVHTCSSTCAQAGMHACLHICTQLRSTDDHTHAHTACMYAHVCTHVHVFAHTCKNGPSASWRYCFSHIRWVEIPKLFGKLSLYMCLVGEDGQWMKGPLGSTKRLHSQWLT